ncbi:MAG: hypothetical protein JNK29_10700, partial [Anaerolineales bacterium]|nr:hypothetical protein [Anaerolineales bacterium]
MQLSALLPTLRALPAYPPALTEAAAAAGLPRAARAPLAAALAEDLTRASAPVLLLAARPDRAMTLAAELSVWAPGLRVLPVPEPSPMFYEPAAWGATVIRGRITALAALAPYAGLTWPAGPHPVLVASARALLPYTLPRREFLIHTRTIQAGQTVRLEKLLADWVAIGYEAQSLVVEPGQFARRGGIVDVFPMADEQPVRLEFFGDEVETLRRFDPATQRSGAKLDSVTITPAREALPKHLAHRPAAAEAAGAGEAQEPAGLSPALAEFQIPNLYPPATLLEYFPARGRLLVDDWAELADALQELEEHAVEQRALQVEAGVIPPDFPLPYLTGAELQDELHERRPLLLGAGGELEASAELGFGRHFHPGPRFGGQLRPLLEHLETLSLDDQAVVVVSRQAARLAELWSERHTPAAAAEALPENPPAGAVVFVTGTLSEGWRLSPDATWKAADAGGPQAAPPAAFDQRPASLHLLTDAEIFGLTRAQPRRRQHRPAAPPEARYAQFTPGEFVVHEDFGIGRFRELGRRTVDGLEREYLVLEFAEGDELYVPVYQADRLTKYVGAEDHPPALSRLGSTEWLTARSRAKQAAEEVARELLDLYARRELVAKRGFGPDTPWQAELEGAFPFVETE